MAGDQKVMTPLRERAVNSFINPTPMSGVKPFASAERFRSTIGSFASSPIPVNFPRSPKTEVAAEVEQKAAHMAKASAAVDSSSAGTVKELRARFQQVAAPAAPMPVAHSPVASGVVRKLPLTAFPFKDQGPASPTPNTSPTRSRPRSPPSVAKSYHAYMCQSHSPQSHGHGHSHAHSVTLESPAAHVPATTASSLDASAAPASPHSNAIPPEERSSSAESEVSARHVDASAGAASARDGASTAAQGMVEPTTVQARGQEGEGDATNVLSDGERQQADVSPLQAPTGSKEAIWEDPAKGVMACQEELDVEPNSTEGAVVDREVEPMAAPEELQLFELDLAAEADMEVGEEGLEVDGVVAVLALGAPGAPCPADEVEVEGCTAGFSPAEGVIDSSQQQGVLRCNETGHSLDDHSCNEEAAACIDMDIGDSPGEGDGTEDAATASVLSPEDPMSMSFDTPLPEALPLEAQQPGADITHDAVNNSLAPADGAALEVGEAAQIEVQAPILSPNEDECKAQQNGTVEESQQGPEVEQSSPQTEPAALPAQLASGLSPQPLGAPAVAPLPSVTPPSPLLPPATSGTPTSATPPSVGSAGSRAFYQQQQCAEGRVLGMAWDSAPASPAAATAVVPAVVGREGPAGKAQADPMAAWWRISGTGEGAMEMPAGALLDGLMDGAVRQLIASPEAQLQAGPSAEAPQVDGAPPAYQGVSAAEEATGADAEVKVESEAKPEPAPAEECEPAAALSSLEEGEARGSFSLEEETASLAVRAPAHDSHLDEEDSTSLRHKIGGLAGQEPTPLHQNLPTRLTSSPQCLPKQVPCQHVWNEKHCA